MKSFHYVVLYGALISAIWIIASEAGGGRRGGGGPHNKKFMELFKKCGDGEINSEEAMKGRDTCSAQLNPTTPATADDSDSRRRRSPDDDNEDQSNGEKNGKKRGGRGKGKRGGGGRGKWKKELCITVCQWKSVGLLDNAGSYSDSGAEAYVKRVYPEKYQGKMTENLKACASENSSKFSMDDNCSGYRPFKKCVMKSHMSACEIQMGMGKGGKRGGGKPKPAPEPEDSEEDEPLT